MPLAICPRCTRARYQLAAIVPNPYASISLPGSPQPLASHPLQPPQHLSSIPLGQWFGELGQFHVSRPHRPGQAAFSSGLSLLGAYAYSKTIDDSLRGSFAAGGCRQRPEIGRISPPNAPYRDIQPAAALRPLLQLRELPFSKVSNPVVTHARRMAAQRHPTFQSGDPIPSPRTVRRLSEAHPQRHRQS